MNNLLNIHNLIDFSQKPSILGNEVTRASERSVRVFV